MLKACYFILIGMAIFITGQYFIFPVTMSCQKSFSRQTIKNPSWAKSYWEDLADQIKQKDNNE